jgi:hypothetical protein
MPASGGRAPDRLEAPLRRDDREAPAHGVRVDVKIAEGADRKAALRRISRTPGVLSAVRSFPGESDAELLSLHLLEVGAGGVAEVLLRLREDPAIEHAEAVPHRKLVR